MELSSEQHRSLHQALLVAFPTATALLKALGLEGIAGQFGMGEDVRGGEEPGALSELIFQVIQWAHEAGRLGELVERALHAAPHNAELHEISKAFSEHPQTPISRGFDPPFSFTLEGIPEELDGTDTPIVKSPLEAVIVEDGNAAGEPKSVESSPRYADVTFFSVVDDYAEEQPLPQGDALRRDCWYEVEVAVHRRAIGLPTQDGQRNPILEPEQTQSVEILVTAEPDGFEVIEQVQRLILPPSGDTMENARFRVCPRTENMAVLCIRLYYQFNLLEVGLVQARVVGKFDDPGQYAASQPPPLVWKQQRREQDYLDFENITPRALHIDVSRKDNTYLLRFTLRNAVGKQLALTGTSLVTPDDLTGDLNTLRDIWEDVAMSDVFTRQLEGTPDDLLGTVRVLAGVGSNLWGKLFSRDAGSSMDVIGDHLRRYPLDPESIVQISVADSAADFVFPWTLLYDREIPEAKYQLPDLEGFWGMRYCVEQQIPGTRRTADIPIDPPSPLKMRFMGWQQFRNFSLETELMTSLVQQSSGRLSISDPPIIDAQSCRAALQADDAQILYFYSHGYTRRLRGNFQNGPNLDRFKSRYEALNADSPLRQDWKYLYDSVKEPTFQVDRSYIELTRGKLYLDDLYTQFRQLKSRPLVILNMCQSAQVTPGLQDSFIHFFLNRGARAVLGTECPMTIEFAHPFAAQLLHDILSGMSVGHALVHARRVFMRQNNPLGLAYTLYGSSTLKYQPACLPNGAAS